MSRLQDNIFSALLSKGYFPKELPDTFVTSSFGSAAGEILDRWKSAGLFKVKDMVVKGVFLRGRYIYKGIETEPETISKPKKFYERRFIHITHPIPQALLSVELSKNWKSLQKILSQQVYSQDRIVFSSRFERAIKELNFPLHRAKKSYIESSSNWLVKTDISRFYPSIYTHSIAWAAYGKENVKANRGRYEGTFADRLDMLVRACNRGQTIGIPIGPETSRIIAEVVSSGVDTEFRATSRELPLSKVDRLQDDWVVGTPTLDAAETAISAIVSSYRKYSLEINGSKTSVTHILQSEFEAWRNEISSFLTHAGSDLTGQRLSNFLELTLRLQVAHPSAPAINYSLSIIEGRRFLESDIPSLESFLLTCAFVSPGSMDRICRVILNLDNAAHRLSKERVSERLLELAERYLDLGATFEVIWILHTLRGLKKSFVAKGLVELSANQSSSALRIILLDLLNKGILLSKLPTGQWEKEATEDSVLSDWTWLYSYEGMRRGWLNDPKGLLNKPFFAAMLNRKVYFYDESKNVKRSSAVKKARSELRAVQKAETLAFLQLARGFSIFEDFESEY